MSVCIWILVCLFTFIAGYWLGDSRYDAFIDMQLYANYYAEKLKYLEREEGDIFRFLIENIDGEENKALIKECYEKLFVQNEGGDIYE